MPTTALDPRPTRSAIKLIDAIRHRRDYAWWGGLVLTIAPIPLLFIGPFMLACMFFFSLMSFHHYVPFTWIFLGLVVLMIPAMFFGEAKQRGGLFAGANLDEDYPGIDGSPIPYLGGLGSMVELMMFGANPRLAASGFTELFLFAPRLMLDGLTQLHRARRVKSASCERAADVLIQLERSDRGMQVSALLRGGEAIADIVPELCLLAFQNWTGVSKDGSRVWLLSEAKPHLPR